MSDLNINETIEVTVADTGGVNRLSVSASGAASVDGSAVTQPVSAVSLPLPTGAATAANQATEIASLAAIDAGIPAALGQTTMSASMPVVLASNQTAIAVTTEGSKLSYSAGFTNITLAAATTDCFTILGSATKTVRITRVSFSCTTTAGSGIAMNLSLIKRSTADTGGTSTTATLVPHDSTNAAATSVVRSYTANPTLGTSVGNVYTDRFQITAAGSISNKLDLAYGTRPAQAMILRGASEQLCLNLGGVTITNPVACFNIEWTEE
jgi:hypothetical protein